MDSSTTNQLFNKKKKYHVLILICFLRFKAYLFSIFTTSLIQRNIVEDCLALFAQRKQYFDDLRSLIVNCVGIKQCELTFNTKEIIVRLILDCSSFACLTGKRSL